MARLIALLAATAGLTLGAKPEFRAGVGRVDITPAANVWMSGYAARTKPSERVATRLHAKALALEDRKGHRVVIVTTDLIGLTRGVTDAVSAALAKKYKLDRASILFNSSHTHAGPVVWPNLATMYFISEEEKQKLRDYTRTLTAQLETVAATALGDLAPATLAYAEGQAGFAINRREFAKRKEGQPPPGPMDHSVPAIEVKDAAGKVKAILFGYTCHNTTLGGDYYEFNGDYSGYAQAAIERRYAGSTALFLLLCGADQNPYPRGTVGHAREHGESLGAAVAKALEGRRTTLRGPVRSAYQVVDVPFRAHTREQFEEEARDKNVYKAARAREMLAAYESGRPIRSTPYPVQALRFAKDLTLLAMGGEVVIDYQLRAKREFGRERLIVAGYSNDVMCYIPSARILKEGGYEGESSMMYYGQPGPFAAEVEDVVFGALRRVAARVGLK